MDSRKCAETAEGCAGSDASHATHARHASHAGTVKPDPRLDGLGVNSSGDSNSAKGGAGAMVFRLSSDFVSTEGLDSKPVFGFNGLGELVYQRTYARYLGDDSDDREEWWVPGTCFLYESWRIFYCEGIVPSRVIGWTLKYYSVGSNIGSDVTRHSYCTKSVQHVQQWF